ncbi:MAG: hypothetical protein LW884_06720 [Bacteroidetes bacterium]|jgi:hypothetical protein|nr:hypothetical protein [Bacteroidota bacterium]
MKSLLRGYAQLCLICLLLSQGFVLGQAYNRRNEVVMTGFGMRFASDFSYYNQARNFPLIEGNYSHITIGPTYKKFYGNGQMEVGLNFLFKGGDGGFQLPLVNRDSPDTLNTRMTGLELDFKVGPRFGIFTPKIGFRWQYRFLQEGMLKKVFEGEPTDKYKLNKMHLLLPIGFSIDLPTGFGATGFGAYYNFGLTNVLGTGNLRTGGVIRTFNFEIHVLLSNR